MPDTNHSAAKRGLSVRRVYEASDIASVHAKMEAAPLLSLGRFTIECAAYRLDVTPKAESVGCPNSPV